MNDAEGRVHVPCVSELLNNMTAPTTDVQAPKILFATAFVAWAADHLLMVRAVWHRMTAHRHLAGFAATLAVAGMPVTGGTP